MIISRGNYSRVVQAIDSSNGTALYLGNTLKLVDGIPSSACAIAWPSGVQSSAVWIHLTWRMVPAPTAECRIFALLGLQGIPVGTFVELYSGATPGAMTMRTGGEVVTLPNGDLGVWIVRGEGEGWVDEYWAWRVYNDDGAGSPIAAEEVVYVGELFAAPVWEWRINEINSQPVDQSLNNTAGGGATRRVRLPAYRALECNVVPQNWATAAIDAENGLQAFQFDLLGQDVIAVVPRPRWPVGGPISDDAVRACAMFCVLARVGPLASNANNDRWPLSLALQETL
jgi:hypothetical protein